MGNCSGNCGGCGDKPAKTIKIKSFGAGKTINEDTHGLLHPPKKEQNQLKSLEGICEHYEFGKVPKSHCMNCIREWVNTVSTEEAEEVMLAFKNQGRKIVVDRIKDAIKERKWNEWHIR